MTYAEQIDNADTFADALHSFEQSVVRHRDALLELSNSHTCSYSDYDREEKAKKDRDSAKIAIIRRFMIK